MQENLGVDLGSENFFQKREEKDLRDDSKEEEVVEELELELVDQSFGCIVLAKLVLAKLVIVKEDNLRGDCARCAQLVVMKEDVKEEEEYFPFLYPYMSMQ